MSNDWPSSAPSPSQIPEGYEFFSAGLMAGATDEPIQEGDMVWNTEREEFDHVSDRAIGVPARSYYFVIRPE